MLSSKQICGGQLAVEVAGTFELKGVQPDLRLSGRARPECGTAKSCLMSGEP